VARAGAEFAAQLRAAAGAFVHFAVHDAALLELMFSLAKSEAAPDVGTAAERVYGAIGDLIQRGQDNGHLRSGDPVRLRLLVIATVQGIASLASTGRASPQETDALLDDAADLFAPGRG
jgi:hypothetical protein